MNKGEQVITGFWDLLNKRMWLDNYKMKLSLKDYKPSEVHCIEYIGKNLDSNVTKLADSFRMTTGAITKLTKKLIEKGLIESYKKPNNKKEIYFRLTEQGMVVYKVHEELHKEFQERDKDTLEQVVDEDFDIMLSFVESYSRHLDAEIMKLDVNIKSECCDKF
ncbi:MarR family transcriptional regulator [Romboutsia sedimentorum]|uniref:MarR family transcriptional regulator n=1 Tax=Romboutsia sedimentorum TaxID=1368474 RepID=UPI0024DDFA2A|nr:MarR family transcriptional regulator [Romboutsia sedimentorum]MDK2584552.1 MarR family transcriptional regulator [Romboutsia sedimentorum]